MADIKKFEDFKLLESCGNMMKGWHDEKPSKKKAFLKAKDSSKGHDVTGCAFYNLKSKKKDKDSCKCGQSLKGTEKFCPECGEKVKAKKKKSK
jgi:hypothetical protein